MTEADSDEHRLYSYLQEKAAAGRLNKAPLDHAIYAPLGWYLRYYAWRRTLTCVTQGPIPFFWGVSKIA